MKTKFYFQLAVCIVLLAAAYSGAAQEQTLPEVTVTTKSNVSKDVSKAFHATFKDASDEQWYKLYKDYLVSFMSDDQKNRALFKKSGYLVYHITYGGENNMPDDVRHVVKVNYKDYNITSAIHVKEAGRDIWVANLETDKKFILVRVEEGDVEEVGNYDKSM